MRLLALALFCLTVSIGRAQDAWPSHPITLIVPFAPGGGNDFIARFVAERLGTALGQPVVVENHPGAGGLVGVRMAVSAKPDG